MSSAAIDSPTTTILPHPVLLQRFEEKIGRLCETLNDEAVRGEAARIIPTFIESVTIYPLGSTVRRRR